LRRLQFSRRNSRIGRTNNFLAIEFFLSSLCNVSCRCLRVITEKECDFATKIAVRHANDSIFSFTLSLSLSLSFSVSLKYFILSSTPELFLFSYLSLSFLFIYLFYTNLFTIDKFSELYNFFYISQECIYRHIKSSEIKIIKLYHFL